MKQREIWLVNLDPTLGAEISKTRPALIVSADEMGILPLRIIAPITDAKPHYLNVPWMVELAPARANGLKKKSVVDLFQVRSVSSQRLIKKWGLIQTEEFEQVVLALQQVFGMRV
ncbi:MAG: type II toxin-antitoxin system PemK/MazF family toxin [Candidatus Sericytochromatia bacterium]